MPGKAVQIIEDTKTSFQLKEDTLRLLLCNENVKNKRVCVVSIAGAFRKGKSFLLTLLIRYMKGKNEQHGELLKGFSWKKGAARETTGIWAWDELYTVGEEDGEETVVLLLDTQGAFDTRTTMEESGRLFGLSALLSSVLIFNVSQTIQEDALQYLSIFADFGRLAKGETKCKPFQTLLFLVRDWLHDHEYKFGEEGGKAFLDEIFSSNGRDIEMREVREKIDDCFEDRKCFLMPHPNMAVLQKHEDELRESDIGKDFKDNVLHLSKMLFSTDQIQRKTVKGELINCEELFTCFQTYLNLFQEKDLPKPQTILRATAQLHMYKLLDSARQYLKDALSKECGSDEAYIQPDDIETLATTVEEEVAQKYLPQLSGSKDKEDFKAEVSKIMNDEKKKLLIRNDSKCPFWIVAISSVAMTFSLAGRKRNRRNDVSFSQRRREMRAQITRRLPSFLNPSKRFKQIRQFLQATEGSNERQEESQPDVMPTPSMEPRLSSTELLQVLLLITVVIVVSVFICHNILVNSTVIVGLLCFTVATVSYFDLV